MKKTLPVISVILILLGIVEIVIAFMGVKMPLPIAIVLGVLFIAFGIKSLLNASKRSTGDR